MDSPFEGALRFLDSWSADLDPVARRPVACGAAVIVLDGVYLPPPDAAGAPNAAVDDDVDLDLAG